MRKFALTGVGSAVRTRGLVADVILLEEMGQWKIALVDTDPTALETADEETAERYGRQQAT